MARPSDKLTPEERQARVAEALRKVGGDAVARRYLEGSHIRREIHNAANAKPFVMPEDEEKN